MKNFLTLFGMCLLFFSASAQKIDFLDYQKSGSFSKPTIQKNMKQVAIAQNTVIFKNISTKDLLKNERNAIGGRKSGGATVKAKVSAFLEFSDSEPTLADYQKLTDDFHAYLNKKFQDAGINAVDWNTITGNDFYINNNKDKPESPEVSTKNEHGYFMLNANKGNTLIRYRPFGSGMNVGFAFGKAKKAADFTDDLKAAVLYLHTVVDFCNLELDASIKTESKYSYDYTTINYLKKYKANGQVAPNMKIAGWSNWDGTNMGGRVMFTEKMKTDVFMFSEDIPAGIPYATELIQDESKMNKKRPIFGVTFGKKMDLVPVAIVTTREKYLAAAKKALENFADQWAAQLINNRG